MGKAALSATTADQVKLLTNCTQPGSRYFTLKFTPDKLLLFNKWSPQWPGRLQSAGNIHAACAKIQELTQATHPPLPKKRKSIRSTRMKSQGKHTNRKWPRWCHFEGSQPAAKKIKVTNFWHYMRTVPHARTTRAAEKDEKEMACVHTH